MDVVNSSINALNALAGKISPAVTSASQTSVDPKGGSVRDHPYGTRPAKKVADGDTSLVATLKQAVAAQQQAAVVLQQQQQAAVAAAVLQQQAAAAAAVVSACSTSPSINQPSSCNGDEDTSSLIR